MNWYEENIEPEIRNIVRILRNNGINTESSCGHRMEIQFQILDSEEVNNLDRILYNEGFRDYKIECYYTRYREHLYLTGIVFFPVEGKYPVQEEQIVALEQYYQQKNKGIGS